MQGRSKVTAKKGDANPLAKIKWWRIVLDESHAVKGEASKQLKAVIELQARLRPALAGGTNQLKQCFAVVLLPVLLQIAHLVVVAACLGISAAAHNHSQVAHPHLLGMQSERRWACTGTPINTDVKDLTGQLHALHMYPICSKNFQTAHLKHGLGPTINSTMFVLRTLMIRHSKAQVEATGAMQLPPKTEEKVEVSFTREEWEHYVEAWNSVRAEFDTFANLGAGYCLTYTMTIMALLMPLRRLCSGGRFPCTILQAGGALRLKRHAQAVAQRNARGVAAAAGGGAEEQGIPPAEHEPLFPGEDDPECSICMDAFAEPIRTPCNHWFCGECIQQVLGERTTCPLCRTGISRHELRAAVYPVPEPTAEEAAAAEAAAREEEEAAAAAAAEAEAMDVDGEDAKSRARRRAQDVLMDSKLKVWMGWLCLLLACSKLLWQLHRLVQFDSTSPFNHE